MTVTYLEHFYTSRFWPLNSGHYFFVTRKAFDLTLNLPGYLDKYINKIITVLYNYILRVTY